MRIPQLGVLAPVHWFAAGLACGFSATPKPAREARAFPHPFCYCEFAPAQPCPQRQAKGQTDVTSQFVNSLAHELPNPGPGGRIEGLPIDFGADESRKGIVHVGHFH